MLPLPSAASGLRADMAEKLLFIWLSEKAGAAELPLPGELAAGLAVQPQQAATTTAAQAVLLVIERNEPNLPP